MSVKALDLDDSDYVISVGNTRNSNKIFAAMLLEVRKTPVKSQMDCGETVDIVPLRLLYEQQIENIDIKKSIILHMYNQNTEQTEGEVMLTLRNPKTHGDFSILWQVLDDLIVYCVWIIGNKAAQNMELITMNYGNITIFNSEPLTKDIILSKFSDVFEGTGQLQGEYHLEVAPEVKPVVHVLCRVRVSLKPQLRQ